jgi:hypothetical protein
MSGAVGWLTFNCDACVLSVTVTVHTRESERAQSWYMLEKPHARCPACGELLSLAEPPSFAGGRLHAAHYWWASFTHDEQRQLGGDAVRWWASLKSTRRQELRDKMNRGDTDPW